MKQKVNVQSVSEWVIEDPEEPHLVSPLEGEESER